MIVIVGVTSGATQRSNRPMTEWEVVTSFINVLEETAPSDNFEEWWTTMWRPMEMACKNVARHTYVLKTALKQFEEQAIGQKFVAAFDVEHEQQELRSLCAVVGLDAEAFLELGFQHHQNACRKSLLTRQS